MNTITHDYSERKKGVKDRWMHNLSFHVFIRLLREDNQKKKRRVLSTLPKQITITLIVIISSLNNKRHKKKTHGQNAASLNFKDPTIVCYVV